MACINNIGPSCTSSAAMGNYSQFLRLVQMVLTLDMRIGRLEIFSAIDPVLSGHLESAAACEGGKAPARRPGSSRREKRR